MCGHNEGLRRILGRSYLDVGGSWGSQEVSVSPDPIGRIFHASRAPTVVPLDRPSRIPIVFSHVASNVSMPEKTLADQSEAAFAIHVEHRQLTVAETWIDGRNQRLPPIARGGVWMFDLETAALAIIRQPFDFSRFYMVRATLDDLTYAHGLPRITHLRMPQSGDPDPVLQNLALTLVGRMKTLGEEVDSIFADWIALAFHAHVVRVYGAVAERWAWRGVLSPQRLRFIVELMAEGLAAPLSSQPIAGQLGMAPSHFARAFRQSTDEPPHQ
jgi:AraC family transcriptional regulator